MDISHILDEKRRLNHLNDDIQKALKKQSGLSVIRPNGVPIELVGNFRLSDNNGMEQGNWDIRILIPKKYPYGFPLLIETSNKIPRSPETHINELGAACVELDIIATYIARKGITICNFIDNYVIRFFCWNLLYAAGETSSLSFWGHREHGHRQFFYEILNTADNVFVKKCFQLLKTNGLPERNAACFCGSGTKYKKCHFPNIEQLKKYSITDLEISLNDFLSEDLKPLQR